MYNSIRYQGSVGQKYGSGTRSFYHQTKIVRKNLDFYCFVTCSSLKTDENVPSKRNKQKNFEEKNNYFCWHPEGHEHDPNMDPDP
jgi:hypothetical protein